MARKKIVYKLRESIVPDPIYSSELVTQFINRLMKDGKKSVAAGLFYDAVKTLDSGSDGKGIEDFFKAIENCSPEVEVTSRRVGGANYQVPVQVREKRKRALAIRWLISSARSRSGKGMVQKLVAEIKDARNNAGGAVKKKEEVFRTAEANKAFAHYRW